MYHPFRLLLLLSSLLGYFLLASAPAHLSTTTQKARMIAPTGSPEEPDPGSGADSVRMIIPTGNPDTDPGPDETGAGPGDGL